MAPSGISLRQGSLRVAEAAIQRVLALDADSPARLAPLMGRRLLVTLTDLDLTVDARFTESGLRLTHNDDESAAEAESDARVRATLAGLMALIASRGRRGRDVTFDGDVGVIQEVKRLFAELDVDWEEQLAHITGDVIAHQAGNAVRGSAGWAQRTGATFLHNLGEYLTEEYRALPPEAEVSAFLADVDRLRHDTDRLEARIRRLRRRQGEGRGA